MTVYTFLKTWKNCSFFSIFSSPGSRLPPIQQPPSDQNDLGLGIPGARQPGDLEFARPGRRPLRPGSGPAFGRPQSGNGGFTGPQTGSGRPRQPIRPTPSILDQIPRDDGDYDDVSVVEGTFSSPPVVIPIQTDNIPFVTNPAGAEISVTTFRRTKINPNVDFTTRRSSLDSGEFL